MNNNTAVLNCLTKQLCIRFEDKFFVVDLTEGDLEDNWNSIQFSNETILDVNFCWDDEPSVWLYGLTHDSKTDTYQTNTNEAYPIKITHVFGSKADYFDMDFQGDIGINYYRVYVGCKMLKRTSSLEIASDVYAKSIVVDKLQDVHVVVTDKYGATKIVEVEDKYITFYQLRGKNDNSCLSQLKDNRIKYNVK